MSHDAEPHVTPSAATQPAPTASVAAGPPAGAVPVPPGPVPRWVLGARPRTLPASVAPVAVGTGVAIGAGGFGPVRALLALVVALALQVGVNYANDYSDGVRGTDAVRVGPVRLVAGGLAPARQVLAAALACFVIAGLAGGTLALLTSWWLLAVGAGALVAAWTYTGGPRPYGYAGLGEPVVFLFFGPVAAAGTAYVQLERITGLALAASVPVGLLAVAVLIANNLRDVPTDAEVGKHTLAVRLGADRTRVLYAATLALALTVAALLALSAPWCLASLALVPLAVPPARAVVRGAAGPHLIPVLGATGRLLALTGLVLAVALALS